MTLVFILGARRLGGRVGNGNLVAYVEARQDFYEFIAVNACRNRYLFGMAGAVDAQDIGALVIGLEGRDGDDHGVFLFRRIDVYAGRHADAQLVVRVVYVKGDVVINDAARRRRGRCGGGCCPSCSTYCSCRSGKSSIHGL